MGRVLLLNADYLPSTPSTVSVRKALQLCLRDRATVLEAEPGRTVRCGDRIMPVPRVLLLHVYVEIPRKVSERVSNPLLFARDGYRCQYCGRHRDELRRPRRHKGVLVRDGERLSRDHMRPVSRFSGNRAERMAKADTWENCVTACSTCNEHKDNRTPYEAGMRLISDKAPRRPTGIGFRIVRGHLDKDQLEFIRSAVEQGLVIHLA